MSEEIVRGHAVVVRFHGERCIHSRHCVLDRPDVFVPNAQGAWIHPDRATPAAGFAASGEVNATASEPLAQRDGALNIDPIVDGPLHVTGNLEVLTGTGKTVNRVNECWLCRCGHSKNRPYCDGSHRAAGFRSEA